MGEITHYIEIPVKIMYSYSPEERQTHLYPGCDAHVSVDCISAPTEDEIYKLIDKDADAIKMACWEDLAG